MLDLRSNGGGLLDEAVLVSSLFVPQGEIVTTDGRKRPERVFNATGEAVTRKPVVVLVNGDTASASEIVTAALHECLGAPVVGQRTFGKGVFGQVFDLENGGALDLIVGDYFTPTGRNLSDKGNRARRAGGGQSADSAGRGTRPRIARGAEGEDRRRLLMTDLRIPAEPRVGVLERRGRVTVVEPFFERGRRMQVNARRGPEAAPGSWCSSVPRETAAAAARRVEIVRALGKPDVPRDVSRRCLPTAAMSGASRSGVDEQAREVTAPGEGRRDLTALPTFTIDPATAATSTTRSPPSAMGTRAPLRPHRGCVRYVRPGGALDSEAARGNSVYLPGTCTMLPKALSANACSLVPGEPRAAVTVEMHMDGANVRKASFYRSTIRSDA